jgi:hypothetical protein
MYDNTGAKKREKYGGNVGTKKTNQRKNNGKLIENRKMEDTMGNVTEYTEKIQSVQSVREEEINERENHKKEEKIKACYEMNAKKVGKKGLGRKEKRRKKRKRIEDGKKYNAKKGERRNSTHEYGEYSTQVTRNRSADRPPAIKYTKGNNNKYRSARTQQWCTVHTQLQRKFGANTSCYLAKEILTESTEREIYCIYCIRQKRGNLDNGISHRYMYEIKRLSLRVTINGCLQVNLKIITENHLSNMENVKGASVEPDYNLQFPILGQRKGKDMNIPPIQRFSNGKTEWNLRYSRYRE